MFNQSGFNETLFNVPITDFVFLNSELTAISETEAVIKADYGLVSPLTGQSELSVRLVANIRMASEMNGQSDFDITFVRQPIFIQDFFAVSEMNSAIRQFQAKEIEFTGNFETGDRIEINMNDMTVTLNGNNALKHIEGDFFNLTQGDNTIVFADTETSRQVQFTLRKRDRWL